MKKSVQKAGSNRVPGSTQLKRQWFVRREDDELPGFQAVCKRKGWQPVHTFGSWNANDEGLAVAIDSTNRIFLIGSKPHVQQLSPAEAMEFYADMFHDSQEGGHEDGQPQFYRAIAALLKGGRP